jgi:hypothetical protein
MAPLNQVSEARTGKIYSTKPENKRFTVRLDDNQWVVTPEKTNKVVAFHVEDLFQEIERLSAAGFTVLNNPPKQGSDGKLIAFLHPKGTGGVLIELCQDLPNL